MSTVIGDQRMHLDLVKEFIECGKLKQARRLVEVVIQFTHSPLILIHLLCPAPRVGVLSNDARLTSVCRVHRA